MVTVRPVNVASVVRGRDVRGDVALDVDAVVIGTGAGDAVAFRDLEPAFARIEADLAVTRIPDALVNGNNDALRRGVRALGWRGDVLAHNRIGCQLSGFCELGCAYDAKQNARKVLVPQALAAGG